MRIAEEIIRINPLPKVIEESEFVDSKGEISIHPYVVGA